MAYPTQITIASGMTVYAGDPQNDEGITSRQVQVSVTYQLERADGDLLHVAAVKARELDAAQEVVWHQIWGERTARGDQTAMDLSPRPPGDEDAPPGGQGDPDEGWPDDGSGDDEPPFYGGGGEDHGDGGGAMPPPYHPAAPQGVNPQGTRPQGLHFCRTGPGNGTGNGQGRPQPAPSEDAQPERVAQSIRKPQRLAIEAQARRLGLSDQALADTIRERFGKTSYTPRFVVDRLTKAEADALLRALQATGHGDGQAIRPGPAMPA